MLPDEQLVVVVVTLIHVLTDGMIGTGMAAVTTC